ncbi:MAG: hypothetical protein K0R15_2112 [Clostridiales bacterium]|jgi:CxxC motif-containing protein|nr:hypothetical protein [Clostridiales bacterium]
MQVDVNDGISVVTGNACIRGKEFAINEILHPMRTFQSTVKTIFPELPMIPIKTDDVVPKEYLFQIIEEIAGIEIKDKLKCGDIIIQNILGTSVNIVSTVDMYLYF